MGGKLCFEVMLGEKAPITTVFWLDIGLYAMTLYFLLVLWRLLAGSKDGGFCAKL